jgi:hypothetical protein
MDLILSPNPPRKLISFVPAPVKYANAPTAPAIASTIKALRLTNGATISPTSFKSDILTNPIAKAIPRNIGSTYRQPITRGNATAEAPAINVSVRAMD